MALGLDTNVLVRFVVEDDSTQCAAASDLMATLTPDDPGHVCLISCVELVWVLTRTYRFTLQDTITTLRALIQAPGLVFEAADDIEAALTLAERTHCDISDALIARRNARAGCAVTHTFDLRAALIPRMTQVSNGERGGGRASPAT